MIEATALVIALAALVVSWISLYLTSLSPAEIEVDPIPGDIRLPGGGFSGPHPQNNEVVLAVFISNTGARGGVLENIDVTDLEDLEGASHSGLGSPLRVGTAASTRYVQSRIRLPSRQAMSSRWSCSSTYARLLLAQRIRRAPWARWAA